MLLFMTMEDVATLQSVQVPKDTPCSHLLMHQLVDKTTATSICFIYRLFGTGTVVVALGPQPPILLFLPLLGEIERTREGRYSSRWEQHDDTCIILHQMKRTLWHPRHSSWDER